MSAELQWAVIRKTSSFLRTNKAGSRNVFSTVSCPLCPCPALARRPLFFARHAHGQATVHPHRQTLTGPFRAAQEPGNLKNVNSFKFNGLVNKKVRPRRRWWQCLCLRPRARHLQVLSVAGRPLMSRLARPASSSRPSRRVRRGVALAARGPPRWRVRACAHRARAARIGKARKTTLTRGARRAIKAVAAATADNFYRPDLKQVCGCLFAGARRQAGGDRVWAAGGRGATRRLPCACQ